MRRGVLLLAVLGLSSLTLSGCATYPADDYPYADGYYDGGTYYYYDRPRDFDYDFEQRYLYGRTYYYPPPYYGGYPGYYPGWSRGYGRDHGDRGRGDRGGADSGPDRTRERGGTPPSPARGRDGISADRATSPRGAGPADRPNPARSSPVGRSGGGPHGPR